MIKLFLLLLASILVCAQALAAPLEGVRLQLKWQHQFQFAGYYAALEQGYYRDAGLEVEIVPSDPGMDPVRLVLDGKAEYGVGTTDLLLLREGGAPVVALAVIFQHSPLALMALKKPGVQSLHDFIGKPVMIEPGSAELFAYLRREGLDQTRIVPHTHAFDAGPLLNGDISGMSVYVSDEPFLLYQAKREYLLYSPRAAGIDFYGDNLFTTESELARHPARAKAFLAASLKGWEYAMRHQEEMVNLIYDRYSQRHDREHLRFEAEKMVPLLQINLIAPGHMYTGRWRHIADVYAEIGLMKPGFNLEPFLYNPNQSPQDVTWLYWILGFALLALLVVLAVWANTRSKNRKLAASEKLNLTIQDSLRQAKDDAELSLAEQRQFLAMLSHELRTPLAVVAAAVQLLVLKLPPALGVEPILARINRGLARLEDFMDNSLTDDRLSSTPSTLNTRAIDLAQLFASASEQARMMDDSRRIVLDLEPHMPPLQADPELLRQMLNNLLSNSIKYSRPGTDIELRLRHTATACVIEVADQGPGIAPADLPLILRKYVRGHNVGSHPGAGLGLSLVSSIVDLHAGKIAISSQEGVGTCVRIELPYDVDALDQTHRAQVHVA